MRELLAFIILFQNSPALEYSKRELAEKRAAIKHWDELAESSLASEVESDAFIEELGDGVLKTSPMSVKPVLGGENVYPKLRARLLSNPGHGKYFRGRIIYKRQRMEKAWLAGTPDFGRILNEMTAEERKGFKILQNLPSVETVEALGEFLSHELGEVVPTETEMELGLIPNSRLAVSALSRLGIANPPTPPMVHSGNVDEGLEACRVWYQQVKDGRRTFRFIGDPVDYDLRGPSKRGAVAPLVRNDKRASNGVKTLKAEGAETATSEQPIMLYMIVAITALVGAYFTFRKKLTDQ